MIKKLTLYIFTLLIFFFFPLTVLAADFQLTYIGTLATEGKNYSQWWYSSPQLTLKGTGTVGVNVEIKIDEVNTSVTVDEDSLWAFTPAGALTEGDHQVILTSEGNTISFVLTIGEKSTGASLDATTAPEATASLPVAGNINYTLAVLILGGIFFFLGGFFLLKPRSLFIRK